MKTALLLFAFCFVGATASFGQTAGAYLTNEPHFVEFASHSEHASQQSLAAEQSVMERSSVLSAQGQRPLWEVAPKAHVTPLGDIAREFRKEHETAKKAEIVWVNY